MTITLELIEPFPALEGRIYRALATELNKSIKSKTRRASSILKGHITKWMMESVEINSLLSQGVPYSLNATFGLTPGTPTAAVNAIVSAIAGAITIELTPVSPRNLAGSVIFRFQPTDFAELLGLPQGHQVTEMGTDLHWLEWLLLKGDTVVVKGYLYQPSNSGRSGGGTMDIGGAFRVPPQHAGTANDNFVTRVFIGRDRELTRILTGFLE
jgi:hypothetical protein